MTQKSIHIFLNEIYSKPPEKKYATNKTNDYHFDDIWCLDILELKGYGPENDGGYRYVLIVIDNFSNFGWTIPLKIKKARTVINIDEKIWKTSKRKPNFIETERGKEKITKSLKIC